MNWDFAADRALTNARNAAGEGASWAAIAAGVSLELGVHVTADMARNRSARLAERGRLETLVGPPINPAVNLIDYPALVEEVYGDAVIAACVHVPQVDRELWGKMMALGAQEGISNLILAGDMVTADMFSKWDQKETWSFDAELATLREYLVDALEHFEFLTILPGNHIRNRIVRITNGHIRLLELVKMCELGPERSRVLTTDLDYVRLLSNDQEFLVAHSSEYSRIDGRVPLKYAEKYETHVIAGNGHRTGHQVSASGRYHAWDIGTLADPRYMGYVHRTLTAFPTMLQSFATVRKGAVRIYGAGLPLTNWEAELL